MEFETEQIHAGIEPDPVTGALHDTFASAARVGATRRVGTFSSATSTGVRSKSTASGPGVPPALLTNWYNM